MIERPRDWTRTTLADAADILDSLRVPVNAKEREHRQGSIPYYGATGQVGWIDTPLFDEELLLLGEDGAPFLDPIKPKAYLISGPAWVNNHVHVLRARAVTSNKFLCYYLNSLRFNDYVNGTTRLKLTQGAMRSIPVLLPPPREQGRIVEVIEEQFSRLDAAELYLQRAQLNTTRLREATLERLHRTSASRFPIAALLQEGRKAAYGVLQPGPHIEGGTTLVRVGDIYGGRINRGSLKSISPAIAERYPRTKLRGGEVVITIVGTIGRAAVVPPALEGANVARAVAVLPVGAQVVPAFLAHVLNAPSSRTALTNLSHEVARKTLNLEDVRRFEVSLPDPNTQQRVVDSLEQYLSVYEDTESQIDRTMQRSRQVRHAILQAAFSGQLLSECAVDTPMMMTDSSQRFSQSTGHQGNRNAEAIGVAT